MTTRFKRLLAAGIATLATTIAFSGVPMTASATTHTYTAHWTMKSVAEPSPLAGTKGGLYSAYAMCTDENGKDHQGSWLWWAVENETYSWESEGMELPIYEGSMRRFHAGTYWVTTWVECPDGQLFDRSSTVTVKTLTASQTVSKKEYRSVKKGMSKKAVFKRLGKMPEHWGSYYYKPSTTFHGVATMKFNKHGKLAHKYWEIYP